MGKKASVPNRHYTEEFKTEAVRLALSIGGNAAAKRLGIPQSTVTNWVRRHREGTSTAMGAEATAVKRPVSELEAENARMRRWRRCTRRASAATGGLASFSRCARRACGWDMTGYAAVCNGKRCGPSTSARTG